MKTKILLIALFAATALSSKAQITGSGTANYFPRFTGTTTIGNSLMYQTAGNQIGIGIGTPAARVELRNGCSASALDALNITNEQNCTGSSTTNFLTVRGYNVNTFVYTTRFVIDPNGRTGVNVASPVAQLDVQPYTSSVNPLLLHSNTGTSIFTVLNAGNVGIGVSNPATTSSTLAVKAQSTNPTYLDLFETSTSVANNAMLRFISSTGTTRHKITEDASGNLLIDAGVSGGGAGTKLKIDGDAEVTGMLGVNIATPSVLNSTLALHNSSSTFGPLLDFFQEDGLTGWNAQIRFGRKYNNGAEQCAIRHVIADNYTTGTLDIMPGFDLNTVHIGSGNNLIPMVRVLGKLEVGDKKITSGTHTDAVIFADGKIAAKYVVVTNSNWADHVFNSDYKLRSLPDLENYIATNHHLPEVPTECEVQDNGVNVGEMNATLLKKVEELTLYTIALQKQMDKLNKELNALTNR